MPKNVTYEQQLKLVKKAKRLSKGDDVYDFCLSCHKFLIDRQYLTAKQIKGLKNVIKHFEEIEEYADCIF